MKWRWAWISMFVAAMLLPAAGVFSQPNLNMFKFYEKGPPQAFPSLNQGLKPAIAGVENWFSDRLAFRFFLTGALGEVYYALGTSIKPGQVVISEDGWLFVGNLYDRTMDQFRGLNTPRPGEARQKVGVLLAVQRHCRSRGAGFAMLVPPNRQFLYPEKLPDWMEPWKGPNRLDLMAEEAKRAGVNLVDSTPLVREAKEKGHQVFLERDSRWNYAGTFQAYLGLMNALQGQVKDLKPLDPALLTYRIMPYDGDLAALIQVKNPPSANEMSWLWGRNLSYLHVKCPGRPARLAAHRQFLPSSRPCMIKNPALKDGPVLLYAGDSFGMALLPYLHQTFGTVINLHNNSLQRYGLPQLMDQYRPDAVVVEIVQRCLIHDVISPTWIRKAE